MSRREFLVRKHYDDDQIAALVYLVAMINAATGCW